MYDLAEGTDGDYALAHEVFKEFSDDELSSLIGNLHGVYPQRGCRQRCPGCHASSLPKIATARWDQTERFMEALGQASAYTGVPVQGNTYEGVLVETFRDSEPGHLRYETGEGIGDFTMSVYDATGKRSKIITSGVHYQLDGDEVVADQHGLDQLEMAAGYSGKFAVSMSIQTMQYRKLGPEQDAKLLAKVVDAAIDGASPDTDVYMDMMYFADQDNPATGPIGRNSNPRTKDTVSLFKNVLDNISTDRLSSDEKGYLLGRLEDDDVNGTGNLAVTLPDRNIGFRVSPYLVMGRAAKDVSNGQVASTTAVTDWLTVLDGDAAETISLTYDGETHEYTREELKGDGEKRHEFVELVAAVRGEGLLAEEAELGGNWLGFFRTEVDLSQPAEGVTPRQVVNAPGVNHGPTVNLLVSDLVGEELQVVIPYKRLYLDGSAPQNG